MVEDIYTRDEAMLILEKFEDILIEYGIEVPSPEDDDRDDDDHVGLYGSTYANLLDEVEERLIEILARHTKGVNVIPERFSGNV